MRGFEAKMPHQGVAMVGVSSNVDRLGDPFAIRVSQPNGARPRPGPLARGGGRVDELGRPYPAANCRWRLVETLVGQARDPAELVPAAREAHQTAETLRALPLRRELERQSRARA